MIVVDSYYIWVCFYYYYILKLYNDQHLEYTYHKIYNFDLMFTIIILDELLHVNDLECNHEMILS